MFLPSEGRRLCKRCRQPFVSEHEVPCVSGVKAAHYTTCPDCDESADEEHEPDVAECIAQSNLSKRLRDGFRFID